MKPKPIYFEESNEQKYFSRITLSKDLKGKVETKEILIEAPFGYYKWLGLLAAIHEFKPHLNAEELIKGFFKNAQLGFGAKDGSVITIKNHQYILKDTDIQKAQTEIQFLAFSDIVSPFYSQLKGVEVYSADFLNFRNLDIEFAAFIGTIGSLAGCGAKGFKPKHLSEIVLAVNQVFLMGYPPKRIA